MKITILVDNEAGQGLVAEHGLSMWMETEDMRILFDTGQGRVLQHNAQVLGIDRKTLREKLKKVESLPDG